MKVLVLGASGFIGLPVAQALVRNGHEVIAQSRSKNNEELFLREEFTPLILDPSSDNSWTSLVPQLDAVIDTLGGSAPIAKLALSNVQAAESAAAKRDPSAAKLTYIWTSGTWIHGEDRFNSASDGSAITNAPTLTAWRPTVEIPLTRSTVLNGIVIRPSLLFGRAGSITALIFQQFQKGGPVTWAGDKGGRLATIHVDDLAEAYRLAVEKAPIAAGNVFDASNDRTESIDAILQHLAAITKLDATQIKYREPENDFEKALGTTSVLRPALARTLLGWHPLKPSLLDGLPTYYKAFLAHSK